MKHLCDISKSAWSESTYKKRKVFPQTVSEILRYDCRNHIQSNRLEQTTAYLNPFGPKSFNPNI